MPEGFPDIALHTDSASAEANTRPFDVVGFLAELGIAELLNSPVQDHAGNTTTLGSAMAECPPARQALTSMKETLQEVGVTDISDAMKKHVAKMAPPEVPESVKKN